LHLSRGADTLAIRVQTCALPIDPRARGRRFRPRAVLAAFVLTMVAGSASAGRPTPLLTGAAALERARTAWAQADFEGAEAGYQEAIDRGGLGRTDVIECYSHLGAAHFIVGKKDEALSAFRIAASVDPFFDVPQEAGKKAFQLADGARKQAPSLKFEASAPARVDSGSAFAVAVILDPAQLPLFARLGLTVRDPATSKIYRFEEQPTSVVRFRVPASMTLPGADLVIRVDALDAHDNQLSVAEAQVEVGAAPVGGGDHKAQTGKTSGGGTSFWKTPWPYIIGGALLAAGGVGIYFAVRPPNEVNVDAPRVQAN
jgi:hypothetical protein